MFMMRFWKLYIRLFDRTAYIIKGPKLMCGGKIFLRKVNVNIKLLIVFTDPKTSSADKNEIRKFGCSYIIFCL